MSDLIMWIIFDILIWICVVVSISNYYLLHKQNKKHEKIAEVLTLIAKDYELVKKRNKTDNSVEVKK